MTTIALVTAALLALSGCAQRESDVGASAIPLEPSGHEGETTILAARSVEWDRDLTSGNGQTLQIGEAQEFRVVSAVRFEPNNVLPDSFTLDSARVRLRVDRIYPGRGESPDLRMLIKEIPVAWSEDSLLEGAFAGRDTFRVIDTLLIPTAAGAEERLYWDVPDSVWQAWMVDDSLNYGVLFEAANSGVIVGFQTAEGADSFAVWLEIGGTQFPEDSGFAPSAWSDTLYATDDGYVAEDLSELVPGRLRVSQGVHRRALLYFPLDSITANPLRTVVKAWIHFHADTDVPMSLVYEGQNLLYKDATMTDTLWFAELDSARQNFIATSSSTFGTDSREIKFDVTNTLAGLVGSPATNGGFSIQATLESDALSRQYFYGHDSEVDSLRPRLSIWWVEP
ncbi:MAG: hypothetical protein IPG71_12960 [bacterium]|nr:hypothetical protein [bacterium]